MNSLCGAGLVESWSHLHVLDHAVVFLHVVAEFLVSVPTMTYLECFKYTHLRYVLLASTIHNTERLSLKTAWAVPFIHLFFF